MQNHFASRYTKGVKKSKSNFIKERNFMPSDEGICSKSNDVFANTESNLNIPAIEHSHSNLQNTDPILARRTPKY